MKDRAPLFIFIFFLILFVTGIVLGEANDVFQKGVTICLSCIGIN